LVRR